MKSALQLRAIVVSFPAALLALSVAARGEPARIVVKPPADAAPVEIAASYAISLNGFDLGELAFKSRAATGTYSASSDVKISALLGAFSWHGVTETTGKVGPAGYRPSSYSFAYSGTARSGSVRMGFDGAGVTSLSAVPELNTAADTVPLSQPHVKGVLDPLSAIMSLTRPGTASPCARKLAIFDGRQRFDLVLSFRRLERLDTSSAGGQPATVMVCGVKYVPIAGYKASDEIKALAASSGIEIAFRPVPAAGVAVPQRVVFPTFAGNAVLEARHVAITAAGREKIALAE